MGAKTGIAWTDSTWSPLRAQVKPDAGEIAAEKGYTSLVQIATKMQGRVGQHCEHVSGGCKNCYSGTWQSRCLPVNGTGLPFDRRSRDLVDSIVDEKALILPLSWRSIRAHEPRCAKTVLGKQAACDCRDKYQFRPRRIFVENQSDLFGEWVTDEQIDRVFAVMALCPQHTFQVLTKRPVRLVNYLCAQDSSLRRTEIAAHVYDLAKHGPAVAAGLSRQASSDGWPLPNVWLGVSVEDQATADMRIPHLLRTPAAKRFVSYEPALGPVNFDRIEFRQATWYNAPEDHDGWGLLGAAHSKIDWLIVGGESGPGARPFDVQWARDAIRQCRDAGVACFVKQMGAYPVDRNDAGFDGDTPRSWPMDTSWAELDQGYQGAPVRVLLNHRAGADPFEWPLDLRVQEFPCEE